MPIFKIGYVLLAISAVATSMLARWRPDVIAPFGELLQTMMRRKANRVALFAVWWWIGWHFFGQPFPN